MTEEKESGLNALRRKTLGANSTRKSAVVEIADVGKVLIRAPSIATMEKINEVSGLEIVPSPDGDAKKNQVKIRFPVRGAVESVLHCCFDPESNRPIFAEADREVLLEEGMGGWLKQLSTEVQKLLADKPAEAAKNSEATATSAT